MTLNFAHRGFSGRFPENTMLAFEKAVEAGTDGIELDVQLSSDGIPVIIHDETLHRTARIDGYVKDFTAAQLKELNVSGEWKGEFGRVEIPTLEEYLQMICRYPVITNIELKTGIFPYEGIEEKVWELVRRSRLEDRVIFSSFNHYSCLKMKEICNEVPCGLLTETWIVEAAAYGQRLGMEYLHPEYRMVTEAYVREAAEHGRKINAWTVNDTEAVRYLAGLGVNAIIGNFPDLAKKALKS